MNRNAIVTLVAGLLCCAAPAVLAEDGLEVTLQVLDDVSEIEGVMMSVEQERERTTADERAAEQRRQTEERAAEQERARESDLGRELDREQESESELEDFDVPEDVGPQNP